MSANENKPCTTKQLKGRKRPKKDVEEDETPPIEAKSSTQQMSVDLPERSAPATTEKMTKKVEKKEKTQEESAPEEPKPKPGKDVAPPARCVYDFSDDDDDEPDEVTHEDYNDEPINEMRNQAIYSLLNSQKFMKH